MKQRAEPRRRHGRRARDLRVPVGGSARTVAGPGPRRAPWRRLQLVEVGFSAGDAVVLRARAVRLRRGALERLAGAREEPKLPCQPPGVFEPTALASTASGASEGFGLTGMELRFAASTDFGPPALAWFRLGRPLRARSCRRWPASCRRRLRQRHQPRPRLGSGCSSTPTSPCTCTASRPASGPARRPHARRGDRRRASPSRGCSTSTLIGKPAQSLFVDRRQRLGRTLVELERGAAARAAW